MFDIGFFELLVIAVVGLLVIGPERLPETLRGIALAVGRIKRTLRDTRQELERQIGADDIRRQLHNEEILSRLEKTRQEINSGLNAPKALADDIVQTIEKPIDKPASAQSSQDTGNLGSAAEAKISATDATTDAPADSKSAQS